MREVFERMLESRKDKPGQLIKTFDISRVKAEDYMQFRPKEKLDGSVLEAFLRSIAMRSTHRTYLRFFILRQSIMEIFRG